MEALCRAAVLAAIREAIESNSTCTMPSEAETEVLGEEGAWEHPSSLNSTNHGYHNDDLNVDIEFVTNVHFDCAFLELFG